MTDATAYRAAKPYLDDGDLRLYHGDVLEVLRGLPSGIAQTCVTSPPYWGLRDYGTGTWSGGDPDCDHLKTAEPPKKYIDGKGRENQSNTNWDHRNEPYGVKCGRCGAQRVDDQLGIEATPTLYIERMVEVFREVWRILRDDATLWLNIADSYGSGTNADRNPTSTEGPNVPASWSNRSQAPRNGLKPKDLVGIPWRLALALQTDGWYLRSDIIWAKPNPMPESVTDRPTKAHEYVFLFSKQPRYFYDADAVREPHTAGNLQNQYTQPKERGDARTMRFAVTERYLHPAGRNLRSVWQIATQPFPEAHFATYPEELVRRCILAGTSERGGCAECGAPWQRVLDRKFYGNLRTADNKDGHADLERGIVRNEYGGQKRWDEYEAPQTTGWEPSCSCDAPVVPQTCLDPFVGSGTTCLVARKHGRLSLGIDLSAEYLAIAARRTQQLSLLGAAP